MISDPNVSPYYRANKDEDGKVIVETPAAPVAPTTPRMWPIYVLLTLILIVLSEGIREQHNALAWCEYQECQDNRFMPKPCEVEKW